MAKCYNMLDMKNTELEGANSCMYDNYEERIVEMSKTALESNMYEICKKK